MMHIHISTITVINLKHHITWDPWEQNVEKYLKQIQYGRRFHGNQKLFFEIIIFIFILNVYSDFPKILGSWH